jgi:PAS domain S-box-containing protein
MAAQKAGKKILIVDDESIIAMHEASVLKNYGYDVVTAYSGKKAVEAAAAEEIDLVLMDIDLGKGKMDGTEAAVAILTERHIPVVFLTSHTEPDIVEKTEKITSYGYVVKNSGDTVLLASIKMAFRLQKANDERIEKNSQLDTLLDNAEDLIGRLDRKGAHLYVNRALCTVMDIPFEEYVGKRIDDLGGPAELTEKWNKALGRTFETGKVSRIEFALPSETGERTLDCKIVPETFDTDGKPKTVVAISRDITEQKAAETALRVSEKQKQVILNSSAEMIAYYDTDLRVVWANRAAAESVGETAEALIGRHCYEIWQQRSGPCEGCPVLQALEKKMPCKTEQKTPDGRCWSIRGYPVLDEEGKVTALVEFGEDITIRKQTEENLQSSLEEKDYLMKELNHRVKNNLAIISSLISLKESALGGEADLSDIRNQIEAVRIVHEKLYQSAEITRIDFADYVRDLLQTIFSSFSGRPVKIESTIDDVPMKTKTAIPLGLIINEIATNAIKHGFSEDGEARFSVGLREDGPEGERVLTLANSGRPFPEDIDLDNPGTLGLRLISALVDQLGGSLELQRRPHPEFFIRFPAGD